jgi:hypothetical protein
MLFSLQKRAAEGKADWLKIAPAMDALVQVLAKEGWPSMMTIDRPDFTIQFAGIDLDGDVIAIHRQGRMVGALAQAAGGRVKAQLFHAPCARTIETLIGLSYNADAEGKLPYYGTHWEAAEDTAAGNGQVYAAMDGRSYVTHWSYGVGIGPDKQSIDEWMQARMEAKPWPSGQGQGAIAINAYAAMSDLLKTLPEEEGQAEVLPPFYALPEPPPEPDPIIPLNAYNLSQPEGRFAFLWALYNDYQEDGLLMAVNHVWDCLEKPRGLRCALMAQKVGKTGTGKRALMRFIKRFLDETLYEFEVPDLPDRQAYDSFDAWNDTCLAHFNDLNKRMSKIIARYEAILDGREPEDERPVPKGVLIKGPWDQLALAD